jgi:hypothetical protein
VRVCLADADGLEVVGVAVEVAGRKDLVGIVASCRERLRPTAADEAIGRAVHIVEAGDPVCRRRIVRRHERVGFERDSTERVVLPISGYQDLLRVVRAEPELRACLATELVEMRGRDVTRRPRRERWRHRGIERRHDHAPPEWIATREPEVRNRGQLSDRAARRRNQRRHRALEAVHDAAALRAVRVGGR